MAGNRQRQKSQTLMAYGDTHSKQTALMEEDRSTPGTKLWLGYMLTTTTFAKLYIESEK